MYASSERADEVFLNLGVEHGCLPLCCRKEAEVKELQTVLDSFRAAQTADRGSLQPESTASEQQARDLRQRVYVPHSPRRHLPKHGEPWEETPSV